MFGGLWGRFCLINTDLLPRCQHMHTRGYHLRTGKHDLSLYDWQRYMDFADKHLK